MCLLSTSVVGPCWADNVLECPEARVDREEPWPLPCSERGEALHTHAWIVIHRMVHSRGLSRLLRIRDNKMTITHSLILMDGPQDHRVAASPEVEGGA